MGNGFVTVHTGLKKVGKKLKNILQFVTRYGNINFVVKSDCQ